MVLLLVEGDDESDNIDGGRGILFQLAVGGVLAEKDGLHEDPEGLVDAFGIVAQACEKGVNVGVLALPMLGKGNEAGSKRSQCLVIHFDNVNFSLGRAGGRGLVADSLAEGLAEFVLDGLASGSFGRGSGGRGPGGVIDFVGGTCHGVSFVSSGYWVAKEGGQFIWSLLWRVREEQDLARRKISWKIRLQLENKKARKEIILEHTIAAGREPCVKRRKAIAQVK